MFVHVSLRYSYKVVATVKGYNPPGNRPGDQSLSDKHRSGYSHSCMQTVVFGLKCIQKYNNISALLDWK